MGVADINVIPDNRMTASTYFDDGHYPFYGRLNGTRGDGAWGPKTGSNKTDYLQVDMGAVYSVCAVETQGEWSGDYWTKSFKLQFSSDNATWQSYKEHNTEKVSTIIRGTFVMAKMVLTWTNQNILFPPVQPDNPFIYMEDHVMRFRGKKKQRLVNLSQTLLRTFKEE